MRNGLAAAKARGAKIGRVRTRNSALIESLLEAGMSFRSIAIIAKCSHGSVSAQKKEYLARKAAEAKVQTTVFEATPALPPPPRQIAGAITDIDATDIIDQSTPTV